MGTTEAGDWVQCGRAFSAEEIRQIRETVAWLPRLARGELAATVCEHLDWCTAAGTPKRQACQKLLERLEAAGLIELPAVRRQPVPRGKGAGVVLSARTASGPLLAGRLRDFTPVHLAPVTEPREVGLWNEYVERFHPLGYKGAFGYRLRYFIGSGSLRLGCVLLAGAARAIAVRDHWIGWSAGARLHNLPRVINNSRFLIFPHVQIPHLASHVLGQVARRVVADWRRHWGFAPVLLETFVDPRHYAGTCYRAAGWELLGETSGRGLVRPGKAYHTTPRRVWVKPLAREFRRMLCTHTSAGGGEAMSKPSRRPSRAAIKEQRRQKKQQEKALRVSQLREGLFPRTPPALPNACSAYATVAQEQAAREEAVSGQLRILRRELPRLLERLAQIPNPRNPHKCRHKLTVLLLYGLLMFVFQFASRREVNREMTRPQFEANLRLLFPELETLPHADTLYRLLRDIDVDHIEQAHVALVERLIRGKKFRRYLINNCYPVAIDGSQKLARDVLWDENLLARTQGQGENRHTQYFVYILEASLAFRNGLVIPLVSEFLEYAQGDTDNNKQDCEQRAFHRLSERLKQLFPRLPLLLLLDGLYANGPVMQRCHQYHWQFMIVLQSGSLTTVWQEYHSLLPYQPDNAKQQNWGERKQRFRWVNPIRYEYGPNDKHHLDVHVVVCDETWEKVNEQGEIVTQTARHAWLSSRPLTRDNVHERCNLGARYRWGIEAGFLVEKHQGYHYEHAFALDWNAMKGYHYLMRMAHLFNTLARFARHLKALYAELGVRATLAFIRQSCAAPWLDPERIRALLSQPFQLQLE